MRIIGGLAAGRILKVPNGYDVRPTPDLVRQAIFNSIGDRVEGARVLDLFSGSGAIGLECLSRGAARVVSVEKSARHAAMIRQNVEQSGLSAMAHELRVQDVIVLIHQLAGSRTEPFDLIIADPPFGDKNVGTKSRSLSQRLLDDPALPSLLQAEGLFILGHTRRDTLSFPATWERLKEMKHGDSMMEFLRPTNAQIHDASQPTSATLPADPAQHTKEND